MLKIAIAGLLEETKCYVAAIMALGAQPVVTLEIDNLDDFDALILPGGGDIAPELFGACDEGSEDINRELDEKQINIARMFINAEKPVLGICKGHQVINVVFGGGIIQDLQNSKPHLRINSIDSVHESSAVPGSILEELYGGTYCTNSAHHQGLGRIGEGLCVISHSFDGVVEAIVHERLPIIGLQWHPERMCFDYAREDTVDGSLIIKHFLGLIKK